MPPADDPVDRLYGLPLEQFTAARNELAKELRGAGERERAAEVAKLKKPSRPAWAINRAVRERPHAANALLDAARDLAAAQAEVIGGADRAALDEATVAEREAVEALIEAVRAELEAAGSMSPAMVDRARQTLHAVAGDPELQDEFEDGRVAADREPVGFGGFGAPTPTPAARRKRGRAPPPARDPEREAKRHLAEARRRAERAEKRVATGERNLERARERLVEAERAAASAEEEVADLTDELDRRRRELDDARSVLAELS